MKSIISSFSLTLASVLTLQAGTGNPGDVFTNLHDHDHDHHHGESVDYLGFDILRGWFDSPGPHDHSIDSNAPSSRYIHPLTVESAFNDSDLFVDYAFNSFDDADEHEIEVELELALTRRFGVLFETAYVFEREGGSTEEGFADLAVAARFVLAEFENVITTASVELQLPTGDNDFTADELIVEPGLLTWLYFGNGFSLNTFVGLEIGTDTDLLNLAFDVALVKDLGGPFALTLESRNEVVLRGDERGDITSEATLGAIYRLTSTTSVRGGWSFPVDSSEFNGGAIASFNLSF